MACTTTPWPGGSSGRLLLAPRTTRTGNCVREHKPRPSHRRTLCWSSSTCSSGISLIAVRRGPQTRPVCPRFTHTHTHVPTLCSSANCATPNPAGKNTLILGVHGQHEAYSGSCPYTQASVSVAITSLWRQLSTQLVRAQGGRRAGEGAIRGRGEGHLFCKDAALVSPCSCVSCSCSTQRWVSITRDNTVLPTDLSKRNLSHRWVLCTSPSPCCAAPAPSRGEGNCNQMGGKDSLADWP